MSAKIHRSPIVTHHFKQFSGDFVGRVTPVPIPNTEVKPTGADDTAAFSCGKVGSRRIYIKKSPLILSGLLFVQSSRFSVYILTFFDPAGQIVL